MRNPEEERLVAELELLGIRGLSRHTSERAESVRPPEALLADLVLQPSVRVRTAVIAVLLAHPELTEAIPTALKSLTPVEGQTLRFFYTAALLLQQQYANRLQTLGVRQPLPERFAVDVGLSPNATARERLTALGRRHRQQTGVIVNWREPMTTWRAACCAPGNWRRNGTGNRGKSYGIPATPGRTLSGPGHTLSARRQLIGQFGRLEVYILDPYSIALSKIARGFEADLEDIIFMWREGLIEFDVLECHFQAVLPSAAQANIIPQEFREYFDEVRRRIAAASADIGGWP